jgi:hypothetical protein
MHVHGNYNLQLAAMGSNREEVQEIAARRAAEVRRRLAAAEGLLALVDEDTAFIKAVSESRSGDDAYSEPNSEERNPDAVEAKQEPGSLFSALA